MRQTELYQYRNGPMPAEAQEAFERANEQLQTDNDGADFDVRTASTDKLGEHAKETYERALAIQANADDEGRRLTEREQRRMKRLLAQVDAACDELSRRGEGPQRKTKPPALRGGRSDGMAHPGARAGLILDRQRHPSPFAALFGRPESSEWASPDEWLNAVRMRLSDPRLLLNAVGTEGVGVDGGFAVPPSFFAGILDHGLQTSEFAKRCRMFPAVTNSLTIPCPNTQNRQNGVAGLTANWASEAQQQTAQNMLWRATELKAHKLFLLSAASNELRDDGLNFAAQLETAMSASFAYALDNVIVRGTGAGQPLGILRSPAAIAVAPESGQAANTIRFVNLADMFGRLTARAQMNGCWFIAPSVMRQLIDLRHPETGAPVLLSGGNNDAAAGRPAQSIFGLSVVVSELCSPLGEAGDIIVGDLSEYALLMRRDARIEFTDQLGFDADISHWRMIARVGGQPLNSAPIQPRGQGEPTLSSFVYLDARS